MNLQLHHVVTDVTMRFLNRILPRTEREWVAHELMEQARSRVRKTGRWFVDIHFEKKRAIAVCSPEPEASYG